MKLFIQSFKAKDAWRLLDVESRRVFLAGVGELMAQLEQRGVTILGWGYNDDSTPHRAPYDFFAAFRFPDDATALEYEKILQRASWYDYFAQGNVIGEPRSHDAVLDDLTRM